MMPLVFREWMTSESAEPKLIWDCVSDTQVPSGHAAGCVLPLPQEVCAVRVWVEFHGLKPLNSGSMDEA